MITKEQFQQMLDTHDWWYINSDDQGKWKAGVAAEKELMKTARGNEEFHKMFIQKMKQVYKT